MPRYLNEDVFDNEEPTLNVGTEIGTVIQHTEEEVNIALVSLARLGGNLRRAVHYLETEYDLSISQSTLANWRNVLFHRRYAEIQHEVRSKLNESIASKLSEGASQASDVQGAVLRRLSDEIGELPTEALPSAARALSQTAASNVEKAALLRGQPTEVTLDRTPEQIAEELRALNVKVSDVIDSTAEEDTPHTEEKREEG